MRKVSNVLEVGAIYPTNNYGDIEILSDSGCKSVTIRFLNTGSIREGVNRGAIVRGKVRDFDPKAITTVKRKELKGKKAYDSFLVLEGVSEKGVSYYCKLCDKVNTVSKYYAPCNIPLSCGCISSLLPKIDLTGCSLNGVLFIGYIANSYWRVKYSCGCIRDRTKTSVESRGKSICYSCEAKVPWNRRHGLTKTPTYSSWLNMKRRCYIESNNRYQHYGAVGIGVYDRWLSSFDNFLDDMGECPQGFSIERLDLERGYYPDNCIWADNKTQANNKSNNIFISNGMEVMSLKHWCDVEKVDYKNAHYRFRYKNESIATILGEGYILVDSKKSIKE